MKPIVLFRRLTQDYEQPELEVAKKYFDISETRIGLEDKLVIPRYSAWPHYRELDRDIGLQRSKLINNLIEHFYIADFLYYGDVKEFTPKTWFRLEDVPKDETMKFIVKGRTKSKKEDWNTKMFANGYSAAANLSCELFKDGLINMQGIIFREFTPLKVLEIGINGLPFSNEHRFFYYKGQRLCHFYYWQHSSTYGKVTEEGIAFADMLAKKVAEYTNFFVLDIAEKASGGWILIEINCGTSSGIPIESADEMYNNLSKILV